MTTPTKTLLIDNEFARVTLWRCNCTLTERKKPYAFYLNPCQSKAPICARDAEVPWPRKPADPDPRYQRHCVNCWWTGEIHETGTYFEPGTDLDDDFRPDGEDVCPRCRRTVRVGPGEPAVKVTGVDANARQMEMSNEAIAYWSDKLHGFAIGRPPLSPGSKVHYVPPGAIYCAATRRTTETVLLCNREMGHDGYHVATDWTNKKVRGVW